MNRKMHYFNITYTCDSNCKFCAANVGLIDHHGYILTTENFEKALLEADVHEGDIVMLSGGEPSNSKYFWEICDICKNHGCIIELTTNGHSFADLSLAQKISDYTNINIQIPVFGLEEEHDYLTGHKGGFNKTVSALDNFAILKKTKIFTVSIKFLLCKATVEGNKKAYGFLKQRYGNTFVYFLNALLVSDKVKENHIELLEPYSVTIKKLGDFIENEDIRIDTIPLCLLSERKREQFLSQKHVNVLKVYSDAKVHNSNMRNYEGGCCHDCYIEKYCDKFLPSYIDYFGESEIRPLRY